MAEYYYYVYSYKNVNNRELLYVDGVYDGNISELILELKQEEKNDNRYRNFVLIFYKKITEYEYVKLNREVK